MILSTNISWGCYSHSPTSTLRNTLFSFHISSTAFDSDESDTYYFSSVLALLKRSLTHLFHMDTSVRSTNFDIWSDHSSRKRLSERAFQRFFFSYLPQVIMTHILMKSKWFRFCKAGFWASDGNERNALSRTPRIMKTCICICIYIVCPLLARSWCLVHHAYMNPKHDLFIVILG